MNIVFLGTSHGVSEKGRFRTSMLVRTKERAYFIDLGAPVGTLLKNYSIPFSEVKAAFITHMHADHALSLTEYMEMCNREADERPLYLPEEQDIASAESWMYTMHGEELYARGKCKLKCVEEGLFYDDNNVQITAIPTHHLKRGKSFAYIFCAEGKKVLFTGDLSDSFNDYPEIAMEEEFDAVICELTHFDVESALEKLNRTKTKKIIFNHVRDDKIRLLENSKSMVNFDYHIANDGDIIEV